MPGEGERREGNENPDKDPFVNYAEELERKQRESNGAGESGQGNSDQNIVPERAPDRPKMDGEVGQKEFEAYARELRERYSEDEEDTDSSKVGQTSSGADAEVPSQEGRATTGSGRRDLEESGQEPASLNPQQSTDSTATNSSSTSVDKEGNASDSTDRTNDSVGSPANPLDSNVPTGSQPDELIPDDAEHGTPTPIETDLTKRRNSARASDAKSTDIGRYQPKGDNRQTALDRQVTSLSAENPNFSQPDKPNSKKQHPTSPEEVKPNLDNPPKIDQTTGGNPKGFPVRGQEDLDRFDKEPRQKLPTSTEPHSDDSLKTKQQVGSGPAVQDLNSKPGIPELPGAALGSANPKGTGYHVTSRNEIYTRYDPFESKINGNIEAPKTVPIVLAGKWESRGAYFLMRKSKFEELTGTKLEVGKTYEIHYRIEGIGGTWKRFSQTENHATRPSIYLGIGQSFRDKLHLGARYDVTVDHVTDKRCLRVTKTHQGPAFRIYRHYIGSMGYDNPQVRQEKNPVVEIGVRNLSSRNQREVKCYTTLRFDSHKPSYNVCMILVKGLGAKFGDIMEVQYVKRHSMNDFAQIFNSHRPKNLENVTLSLSGRKLTMEVDKNEIYLQNPRLSTNKLEVCLRAEIEHTKKPIFFWYDGNTARARFNQKSLVRNMNAVDSGIDISYRRTERYMPTFRFRTDKFDVSKYHEEIRLVSTPEYNGDSFVFRVSPKLQEIVKSRINAASGAFEARCVKGDISEEIQRYLLSTLGQWKELEYHPFDHIWRTNESKKRGPDSVQRSSITGGLSYFELRWSTDAYQAYFSCRKQALRDLQKWPAYKGEPVKMAHVGTLEWDVRKSELNFYLREAAPERLGHNAWRVS